jgi:hypothetical protein
MFIFLGGPPGPSNTRDDKKERVVERERTVAKGQGSCWGGGNAFSIDSNRFVLNQKSHSL